MRDSSEVTGQYEQVASLQGNEKSIANALSAVAKTVAQLELELGLKGPNIRKVLRTLAHKGVVVMEGGKGETTAYRLREDPSSLTR